MKKIFDLASVNIYNHQSKDNHDSQGDNQDSAKVVNKIFDVLQGIFTAHRHAWPSGDVFEQAKREWLKAFIENDISDLNRIRFGIKKMRLMTSAFVPTVGQFIEWCTPSPEALGLPSLQKAYEEACRLAPPYVKQRNWSHDAVFHAAQETGLYFISNNSKDKSYPMFKYNYEQAINMLMNGEKLREIPKAITKKNHIIVDGIEFELIGRNAVSNIVNYQVAGGTLKFSEFDKLFTETLKLKG